MAIGGSGAIGAAAGGAANKAASGAVNQAAAGTTSNLGGSSTPVSNPSGLNNTSTASPSPTSSHTGDAIDSSVNTPEYRESVDNNPIENQNDNLNQENIDQGIESETNEEQSQDSKKDDNQNGQQGEDGGKSETQQAVEATGRAVAAYFTKGDSAGIDKAIINNQHVQGVIKDTSDTIDKVPGAKQVAHELKESGVTDGVNDALDTYAALQSGDIKETLKKGKDTAKDLKKIQFTMIKKQLILILIGFGTFLFIIIIFVAILGPVLGGFIDIVNTVVTFVSDVVDYIGDLAHNLFNGTASSETIEKILTEVVDDYDNLSDKRKNTVNVAVSILGYSYLYGASVTGPNYEGLDSQGIDCSSYVQWVLWTALGTNPAAGKLTTQAISDSIGSSFIEITKEELQPGDIGLKRLGGSIPENNDYNHTGIYMGSNQWAHASSGKGVVVNNYTGFTIYLRYVGME